MSTQTDRKYSIREFFKPSAWEWIAMSAEIPFASWPIYWYSIYSGQTGLGKYALAPQLVTYAIGRIRKAYRQAN